MPDAPAKGGHRSPPATAAGIGCALRRSRRALTLSGTAAVLILGCDLTLVGLGEYTDLRRAGLCVAAICALSALAKWDWSSLGLGLRVRPSLRYWFKAAIVIGILMALFLVAVFTAIWLLDIPIPEEYWWPSPSVFWRWTPRACLVAPFLEETIYRLVVCSVGAALLGRWPTIVLSGLAFAGLHLLYGNPSPENLVAGFFLGWAYLKSQNVLIPIALHSLGNLAVGLWNLGVVLVST